MNLVSNPNVNPQNGVVYKKKCVLNKLPPMFFHWVDIHWVTRIVLSSLTIWIDLEFVNKHASLGTLKKSLYNFSAGGFNKLL